MKDRRENRDRSDFSGGGDDQKLLQRLHDRDGAGQYLCVQASATDLVVRTVSICNSSAFLNLYPFSREHTRVGVPRFVRREGT